VPSAVGSPASVKSITGGLTRPPDPILVDLMQLGWHPDPEQRPDIDTMVEGLLRCWRNSLHRYSSAIFLLFIYIAKLKFVRLVFYLIFYCLLWVEKSVFGNRIYR
jgi:hypothetical protein